MKNFTLFLFAMIAAMVSLNAQNPPPDPPEFPMGDIQYDVCLGTFTDSQGSDLNYLPSETLTTTICSPFPTDRSFVNFTAFDLAPGDVLIAYDGDSASAPFIGAFGSFLAPSLIEASLSNTSGCLTFVFTSNAVSQTAAGWEATIGCIDSCQTIQSQVTVTPSPSIDGVVRICQGDTVTVNGTPVFPSAGTPTEELQLPDGSVISGNSATQTIQDPGVYIFDYIVTDPLTGCRDRTTEDVVVLVSTTPDFTGTGPDRDIVCFGEQVDITGMAETQQFAAQIAPPESGSTFLPDQAGSIYTTPITVNGFNPGQTFNAATDLQSVYINMEHSYMGDLDIILRAPNGVEVFLMEYPNGGGGTWLGEAIDVTPVTNAPGVGYTYTFTEVGAGTQTLAQAGQGLPGAVPVPEGDYLPEDPFADFIGSDLNGDWEIVVIDNLSIDNGWIFEWGLNFNPNIIPPNDRTYEPQEVTLSWINSPDIVSTSADGSVVTVAPAVVGQNCYDLELLDDFGCTYIETVCVEMIEEIVTATPGDIEVCATLGNTDVNLNPQGTIALNNLAVLDYRVRYYTDRTEAENGAANNITSTSSYPVTADTEIFIRVENARSGCFEIESFMIDFSDIVANPVADLTECDAFPFDDSDGFDLTQEESTLLGTLNPNSVDVLYYTSQAAAQAGVPGTEISNPTNYDSASDEIFVRVQDSANPGCFDTTSFNVIVTSLAPTTAVADVEECDTFPFDLTTDFDLSVNESGILNNRTASDFTFQYYTSEADALANVGEIPANYEGADMEEIFVLLTENATGCAEVYSFMLTTLAGPPIGTAPDLSECDEAPFDLRLEFDLSQQDDAIRGGLSPTDYSVGYYTSESNAFNDIDQLPSNYEAADGEIIYARLTDLDTGCPNVSSFNITVEECEVVFPEGFTPNNDGVNDTFEIPNIQQYANFSLKVFNRYGTMVYETSASNYVEFDGVPNSGLNSGDGLLPVGTYFYTMEFNDGETQDIASWLYINY